MPVPQGPYVKVTVDETGDKVKVEVMNNRGPSCKKLMEGFERMGKVLSHDTKPEFNEAEAGNYLHGTVSNF